MQRELEVLSEQYSQKCLENAHLAQALEAERQALRQCQRENQELNAHNQVSPQPGKPMPKLGARPRLQVGPDSLQAPPGVLTNSPQVWGLWPSCYVNQLFTFGLEDISVSLLVIAGPGL